MKFFKTTGFNWKNGHVCAEHWSSGVRKDIQDLPDIVISEGVYKRLQQNCNNLNEMIKKNGENATKQQKEAFKLAKKKFFYSKKNLQKYSNKI